VNVLGDNIDIIKKNMETITDTSKEVRLEVISEKVKNMLLSHHQNAGENHEIERANRSFENIAQFKYLETTVTDKNSIEDDIKRSFNSGNTS
jgi:hypothetical protein